MNSETLNRHLTDIRALAQLPNGGSIPDLILQLSRLHDAVGLLQRLIAGQREDALKKNAMKQDNNNGEYLCQVCRQPADRLILGRCLICIGEQEKRESVMITVG